MIAGSEAQKIKNDVVTASRILIKRGICEAFGHVSARLPGDELFVITPKASMILVEGPEDLVTVNLKGERVDGQNRQPLETWLHTCIYLEESAILQYKAQRVGQPICFTEQETRERGTQLLEAAHIYRAWEHYKKSISQRR